MRDDSHIQAILQEAASLEDMAAHLKTLPCYLYRPRLSIDGNQWCALYGENLQDGVAGFGDTPEDAYADFNKNWVQPLPDSPSGRKRCAN